MAWRASQAIDTSCCFARRCRASYSSGSMLTVNRCLVATALCCIVLQTAAYPPECNGVNGEYVSRQRLPQKCGGKGRTEPWPAAPPGPSPRSPSDALAVVALADGCRRLPSLFRSSISAPLRETPPRPQRSASPQSAFLPPCGRIGRLSETETQVLGVCVSSRYTNHQSSLGQLAKTIPNRVPAGLSQPTEQCQSTSPPRSQTSSPTSTQGPSGVPPPHLLTSSTPSSKTSTQCQLQARSRPGFLSTTRVLRLCSRCSTVTRPTTFAYTTQSTLMIRPRELSLGNTSRPMLLNSTKAYLPSY